MKREFVPPNLVLLCREKGFNELCLAYYNTDPYLSEPPFNLGSPFDHEWCLPAPFYQQVIDWFREKHNILLQPYFTYDTEFAPRYYFYLINIIEQYDEKVSEGNLDYYIALNKAIEEALKLIK